MRYYWQSPIVFREISCYSICWNSVRKFDLEVSDSSISDIFCSNSLSNNSFVDYDGFKIRSIYLFTSIDSELQSFIFCTSWSNGPPYLWTLVCICDWVINLITLVNIWNLYTHLRFNIVKSKNSKFKNLSIKSQENLSPSADLQNRHCLFFSHLSDQGPVIKPQLVFETARFAHSNVLLHAVYQVLSSILSFAIYFHHFTFFFLFLTAFILVS